MQRRCQAVRESFRRTTCSRGRNAQCVVPSPRSADSLRLVRRTRPQGAPAALCWRSGLGLQRDAPRTNAVATPAGALLSDRAGGTNASPDWPTIARVHLPADDAGHRSARRTLEEPRHQRDRSSFQNRSRRPPRSPNKTGYPLVTRWVRLLCTLTV